MMYAYPASNAVDITFASDGAHAYPSPGAVNFSFYEFAIGGIADADAAAPSPLGEALAMAQVCLTAKASAPSLLGQASVRGAVQASAASSVATPLGPPSALSASAASWASADSPLTPAVVRAVMGGRALASAPSMLKDAVAMAENPVVLLAGSTLTQCGAIAAVAVATPEGASTTQYGAVWAKYDVSVSAAPSEPSTQGGTPLAWKISTEAVTTVHDAYGARTTGYGTPGAGHPHVCDVPGTSATGYGVPSAAAVSLPGSACTTLAGQPSVAPIASVKGVRGTQYGTPANIVAHIVAGACRTKYGKAKTAFPDAHMVFGLNNGRRAGVPRAVELA